MSGAVSFVLGLLGLGASGAVSARQNMSENKKIAEYKAAYGYDADTETQKMYKRVEEEWWIMCKRSRNCLNETWLDPNSHVRPTIRRKNWFRRHLEAKGIPYDEVILDRVTGVTAEKRQIEMMYSAGKKRRGWF